MLPVTPKVEIAFSTGPYSSTLVWEDVTRFLRSGRIEGGRETENDHFDPRRATLVLDNRDRRFDATHTGGPYYPNVKANRRIRVQMTYGPPVAGPASVSGLALWLKADALGLTDGAAVASWPDSSPTGASVTQATASARPTYKTAQVNGLPVVRFDGGDYLDTTASGNVKPLTAFAVVKVTDYTADREILGSTGNGVQWDLSGGQPRLVKDGIAVIGAGTSVPTAATWAVIAVTYDGAGNWSHHLNGAANGSGTNNQTFGSGTLRIGRAGAAAAFFLGDIAEVVVYGAALSSTDRDTVTGYLGQKYGITVTPAVSGPVTYDRFYGYVDSWVQEWRQPRDAFVTVSATDGFKLLERAPMLSSIKHEWLLDGPLAAYMFDDSSGATAAGELTGKFPAASIEYGKGPTAGTYSLGDNPVTGDEDHTSFTVTPHITVSITTVSDGGWVARLNRSGPALTMTAGFTVECAFRSSETRFDQSLFLQYESNGAQQVHLLLGALGELYLFYASSIGGSSIGTVNSGSAVNYADGRWHHVAATVDADRRTARIYVDGVLVGTNVAASALSFNGATAGITVGANYTPVSSNSYLSGSIAALGMYLAPLSAARIAKHATAVTTGFAGESPGARVNRILDYIGWPTALRSIDTGTSTLTRQSFGSSALDALHRVEDSEAGALFMTRDGKVRFRGRRTVFTDPRSSTSQATFGDDLSQPTERRYAGDSLTLGLDETQVRNDITVTRGAGGVAQRAVDAASQADYGIMHYEPSGDILVGSDAECFDHAHWLLSLYKDGQVRIPGITIQPGRDPANLYPLVLGLDFADRITVIRRPPGGGSPISVQALLERVRESFRPGVWEGTEWNVSPAPPGVFMIGDPVYGYIEGNAVHPSYGLAY